MAGRGAFLLLGSLLVLALAGSAQASSPSERQIQELFWAVTWFALAVSAIVYSGNPVDTCPPCFASLDATLTGNNILEVKSTKYWSEGGGLKEYLEGTVGNQLLRQRQLLQIWGGTEIRLYVHGNVFARAQAFLSGPGFSDIKLFIIPGT